MANDIKNLLSRFGAAFEDYLEVDDVHQYREPLRVERPPSGVTRASPQAEAVVHLGDSDGRGSYALAAGRHAWLRSRLSAAVTHGHAS